MSVSRNLVSQYFELMDIAHVGIIIHAVMTSLLLLQALLYLKELQGERGGKCVTETLDEEPIADQVPA